MASFDFEVNDYVILETRSFGILEGLIVGHDKQKTHYNLRDVICLSTKKAHPRPLIIHRPIIISATVLKQKSDDSQTSESEDIPYDLRFMKDMRDNHVLIRGCGDAYVKAMQDLKQCECIGFIAEDSEFRYRSLHMFAMSTPDCIYLFDVLTLKKLPDDMKKLLESSIVKKAIYNSNGLADCLKYHYNVMLNGIFDVQLADAYITKIKTGISPTSLLTYKECVSKYLKIPGDIYIQKPKLQKDTIRPLLKEFLLQLAQNISFMQMLWKKLRNIILEPLHEAGEFRAGLVQ